MAHKRKAPPSSTTPNSKRSNSTGFTFIRAPTRDEQDHLGIKQEQQQQQPTSMTGNGSYQKTPLDPTLPTNLVLPEVVPPYERPGAGEVRVTAYNVCGIKQAEKKVSSA